MRRLGAKIVSWGGYEMFHKLRHAYFDRKNMTRCLPTRSETQVKTFAQEEKIVVAGFGIAALTFVEGLARAGFRNVTLVGPDDDAGGTCVNLGCMPSEYFYRHREKGLTAFVGALRESVQGRFKRTGFEVRRGRIESVEGKEVILEGKARVAFDRLVLATGAKQEIPTRFSRSLSLSQFWNLGSGRLAIVTDGQPGALSLADIALTKGLKVELHLTREFPLSSLPAFQYFEKSICEKGLTIYRSGRISDASLKVDHLLYYGQPKPNIPLIDGKKFSLYDVNLRSAAFRDRADIICLGDTAGFLSASEAELYSTRTWELYTQGIAIPLEPFASVPFRLHAERSFASVGRPESLFSHQWKELDFNELGWTAVHQERGKLWYQWDSLSHRVTALQICHAQAGELISIGTALLEFPLDHPLWHTLPIHPSAAEIFRLLVTRVSALQKNLPLTPQPAKDTWTEHRLPSLREIAERSLTLDWLTEEERSDCLLARHPEEHASLIFATRRLLDEKSPSHSRLTFKSIAPGKFVCERHPEISYDLEEDLLVGKLSGNQIRVRLHADT